MKTTGNTLTWLFLLLTLSIGAKRAEAQFERGLFNMHGGADDFASSPLEAKASPATSGSATAIKWAENPIDIKVGVAGWVIAESNTTVNIILNNVTNTITGAGTNDTTNVIPFFITTRTMEPMEARVEGAQVKQVYLEFIKPGRTDFSIGGRNRGKKPKDYRIYINEEEKKWVSETHTNGLGAMTKSWKVLLRAESNSGPGGTVEEIREDVAPGDGSMPQIGPGNSYTASQGGIKWEVPVGRLRNGKSASNIRLVESGLSSEIYTPWPLLYEPPVTNRNEINAIYDSGGLRQIIALQTLVDIVTVSSNSYEIRFYPRSAVILGSNDYGVNNDGFYDLQANSLPFVVWRISNPDTNGANNRIQLQDIRGTNIWTSMISYNSTNTTWRLEYGAGGDLRIEERRVDFINYPMVDRLETNVVMNASNEVQFICVESYHPYEWGWELEGTVTDPSGASLATTYSYYTTGTQSDGYGKLKHVVYPDGFWEKRIYADGRLARVMNPLMDGPAGPDAAETTNSRFIQYYYFSIGTVSGGIDTTSREYALCEDMPLSAAYPWPSDYLYDSIIDRRQLSYSTSDVESVLNLVSDDYVYIFSGASLWYRHGTTIYKQGAGESLNGLEKVAINETATRHFHYYNGVWNGMGFIQSTNYSDRDWMVSEIFAENSTPYLIQSINDFQIGSWGYGVYVNPGITTNQVTYFVGGLKIGTATLLSG